MKKMGFVFNGARCNGCAACVLACKEEHGCLDQVWMRTRKENLHTQAFLTLGCNHCDEPACLAVCPVQAYSKEPDGWVVQDHAKCIGCQACVAACPYGVPTYSPVEKKTYKCDGCIGKLNRGGIPACVDACTCQAIEFGPIDDLRQKYSQYLQTGYDWAGENFGLASPSQTKPNLVIVPLK